MPALLTSADALLRPEHRPTRFGSGRLVALVVLLGLFYGAVMGSFGGFSADRLPQVVYSAVKVPLLLGVTFAVCLPSFFLFNTLFGVRGDFRAVLRALLSAQAGLTVVLAALAPYTAVWYLASAHYRFAILFNALMFAIASVTAQCLLRRWYRPLIARNPRHRLLLRLWLAQFVFVGIQAGWVLRPFIGDPLARPQFLRPDGWSNAYVFLAGMFWEVVTGTAR